MRTLLRCRHRFTHELPDELAGDDNRLSEELLTTLLREYSEIGDRVLDPFAGFGTTLFCAERAGRHGYGVERDSGRVKWARTHLRHPERLRLGDARTVGFRELGVFDLSISSPPYMHRHESLGALSDFAGPGGYVRYLDELGSVYTSVAGAMRPDGRIIIEIANLRSDREVTTLAWDLAGKLGTRLRFDGELVVDWEAYGHGYDHSYCLVFKC